MPLLLPRAADEQERSALVLAFGRLSMLEVCALLGRNLAELETPSERICVLRAKPSSLSTIWSAAGIHKFATMLTPVAADGAGVREFAEKVAGRVDQISNFSLSGYGLRDDDYEGLLEQLSSAFRTEGLRKVHLLRPKGNELLAEQVVARGATDVIVFPYKGAFCLGLTSYVPNGGDFRERGVNKPVPRSEISLSPRLARTLVNLSGAAPGQTLLDPFCGSGTVLAEGLLKSLKCVGIDSSRRLIKEARLNLRWASGNLRRASFRLETGDARELRSTLGGGRVDGVATEPILLPRLKGRLNFTAAKEMIDNASNVYAEALASIATVVKPGGRIVIVVPVVQTIEGSEIYVGLEGKPLGLTLYQPGPIYFQYPVRLSFESTRWIKRAVYVFEVRP